MRLLLFGYLVIALGFLLWLGIASGPAAWLSALIWPYFIIAAIGFPGR